MITVKCGNPDLQDSRYSEKNAVGTVKNASLAEMRSGQLGLGLAGVYCERSPETLRIPANSFHA